MKCPDLSRPEFHHILFEVQKEVELSRGHLLDNPENKILTLENIWKEDILPNLCKSDGVLGKIGIFVPVEQASTFAQKYQGWNENILSQYHVVDFGDRLCPTMPSWVHKARKQVLEWQNGKMIPCDVLHFGNGCFEQHASNVTQNE